MSALQEMPADMGDCACGGMISELPDGRVVCSVCDVPELVSAPPEPLKTDCSPKGYELKQSIGEGLPLLHASEILSEVPEAVQWLLRDYIALGAITLLAGRPKVGKSTFMMGLLGALSRGAAFLERPTDPVGVLYLTEERGHTLTAKINTHGLADGQVYVLPWHKASGMSWPAVVAWAVDQCREQGLRLLVVDTLDKWAAFRGDDEQKSGAVNEAMAPLMLAAGEGLAVVVIGHQRKADGKYGDAVRGSNALAGSVDVIVELERPGDELGKSARVVRAHGRFESTPDELFINLTDDGYEVVGDVHEARHASETATVLAALDEIGSGTVADVAEEADLKEATVRRRLEEAHERGDVVKTGSGKRGDPFRFSLPPIDCSSPSLLGEQSIQQVPSSIDCSGPPPVVEQSIDAASEPDPDPLVERLRLEFDAVEVEPAEAVELSRRAMKAGQAWNFTGRAAA